MKEKKMNCPICDGKTIIKNEINDVEFRKEFYKVRETYYLCEKCGEKIVDTNMGERSTIQLYNQYREKHNLLFPSEVTEIREKYGLSKSKMSLALGWGENTYGSYEKGAIPNESHNSLLRLIDETTQFIKLVRARQDIFSEYEMKELEKRIEEFEKENEELEWIDYVWPNKILNDTGYVKPDFEKFTNIVLFFLTSEPAYKTKLNKLLFYTDFYHYKLYCIGITGSRYRAIPFGPVPSEYDAIYDWLVKKEYIIINENIEKSYVTETFKNNKAYDENIFNEEELDTMKKVYQNFKDFNATQLKNYSHKEKAWIENEKERKIINYQEYAFELSI